MELYKGNTHETCIDHTGRANEFYCADHNDFCCSICVFKLHKDCSSILAPDEVETFISEFKVLLESDMESLQKEVSKLLNETMGAYYRFVSTKTKTEAAMKALRDSIDEQLHRLQTNTSSTMNYALEQELPKYQNEIEDLRSIQNDLSDSIGTFPKAALNDQNASKRTVEQMRSLIFQKKRFKEISKKVKTRGKKHAVSKQVAFNVSVQVQEVLKTLSKLEQLGTISICQVAESKKETNMATLSLEAGEDSLEVVMLNTTGKYTDHTDNKLNNMGNQDEEVIRTNMETKEANHDSETNDISFDIDSVASGSRPHLDENILKSIESNFCDGVDIKNDSLVTVDTLQVHQLYGEELRSKDTKEDEIDSDIHAISSDSNSEVSQSLLRLGESQGKCTGSISDVTNNPNETILVPAGTPHVPTPSAEERLSNARDNTQVEEEENMGCFALRKTFYTMVGRGDKTVGNLNTKRARSLPVFRSRTRRQHKDVVVIEDDGS
ncbi:hypothetical protein CHS0354_009508, partial [Potamilus streckersoni]